MVVYLPSLLTQKPVLASFLKGGSEDTLSVSGSKPRSSRSAKAISALPGLGRIFHPPSSHFPPDPEAKVGRFLLRGLRIGASTVSIVELLRSDWTGGISAGVAWLVFLQVERRLPPLSQEQEV